VAFDMVRSQQIHVADGSLGVGCTRHAGAKWPQVLDLWTVCGLFSTSGGKTRIPHAGIER
jgi:hypothetical protein